VQLSRRLLPLAKSSRTVALVRAPIVVSSEFCPYIQRQQNILTHLTGVQTGRVAKSKAKQSLSTQATYDQDDEVSREDPDKDVSDKESPVRVQAVKKEATDKTFEELCEEAASGCEEILSQI
jgi:hypothetical protein